MQNVSLIFFLPLWVFLFSSSAYSADFEAKAIHGTDGDTLTVLNDANERVKIRLNDIDCPEKAQAYGNQAKQFTKNLVAGKTVTIKTYDTDKSMGA
jgi:endonuclease YncB( thermonuclease family)